jgi:hypothetical protein
MKKEITQDKCLHCESCSSCEFVDLIKLTINAVTELDYNFSRCSDLIINSTKTKNFISNFKLIEFKIKSSEFLSKLIY